MRSIPRRTIDVAVPLGINGSDAGEAAFRLREMSGTERDRFEMSAFKETKDGKREVDPLYLRARLVALCLVDEDGNRLYSDNEIEALSGEVGAATLIKLFEAAQKLNGLDAAATERAEKNSASVPADASTSGLH